MIDRLQFVNEVEKVPPSPEMLKKIAVTATIAAERTSALRVVRRGFADRYLWAEQIDTTDEIFSMRSGKFRPEAMAMPLDVATQTESFVGMSGEYHLRLRELHYERSRDMNVPWIGQLQTLAFDWSQYGGVTRSDLEVKAVPSMTYEESQKLREFYATAYRDEESEHGIHLSDFEAEELLPVTDCFKVPLYAEHCARLLADLRRASRVPATTKVA